VDIKNILSKVDHTLLLQTATLDEILAVCDEAIEYKTASVCIPPCYVEQVKGYVNNKISICTVIGFPNGYNTTKVKCIEAEQAIKDGADEIDMVINIGQLKAKNYDYILNEINQIKKVCGTIILKVIIETCLLTDEEKIKMCEIVSQSDADFIKTSTGFSTSGATFEDIKLFADNVSDKLKIKAAGGISSLEDAQIFLDLGANRLGTSKVVKIIKKGDNNECNTSY